jgi:hypothetical protein
VTIIRINLRLCLLVFASLTATACAPGFVSVGKQKAELDSVSVALPSPTPADLTPPDLVLVSPAAGSFVQNSVVVQGACESGLVVKASYGLATSALPCLNGAFANTLTLDGADGSINISVTQTDQAGNETTRSVSVIKDTLAPNLTIASPLANANVDSIATISGQCESGLQVAISGSGLSSQVSEMCASGAYSIQAVFSEGSGVKFIEVSQTDLAGNKSLRSRSFNKIVTNAPVVTIAQPLQNSYFKTTLVVSGLCESGFPVQFSGSGWLSPASTTCSNGQYSILRQFHSLPVMVQKP